MSGSMDINQDVSMNGTLDVQGATTIFGRLSVNDDASFSGDVDANDLTAQGRLFVNKELYLYKDVTTSASLECKNLTVNGFFTAAFQDNTIPITAITNSHIMTSEGDLQQGVKVSKDAKLLNRVFVTSDIVGSNDLLLSNDAVLSNRLYVSSDVSLNKTVFIGDDATIAKRLFAAGDVSLNGNTHMEGDVTIGGKLTAANYADNTIPTSAFIDDVLTGSNFSNDIVGGNRLYLASDASFGKTVTIVDDATIEKRLFTTGDVTISGNTVAQKHLNVTGTITAGSYADNTIPRTAIIGGVLQDTFATDVTMNEKLVVQKELTTNTRLFVDEDAQLNKRLFVSADASFSNKVYVANNLTIGGTLSANNYGTGVIPQAAIAGGVGLLDTNFSDDVIASKRLFVTSDVSFGKTVIIVGDATIENRLFQNEEATFSENVTAEKGLTVNGLLTVGNYGTGTIPQAAIDGGIGLADTNFTTDVVASKRLFVASDVSFGKNLVVVNDATIAKRLFQKGEATFSENVTASKNLDVTGTLTANYADNTISQSALIGGVGLTDTNFTDDVITTKRLFVADDVSFGKNLVVVNDATIAKRLFQKGEATFSENVTASKNLDVTGTLTVGNYGTGVIPQTAIDGGIGLTDTNFTDADVNVDKRLFVKGDASFNKVLIEKDLTLNERLFANKDVTLSNNVIINGTGNATTTISTPLTVTGAILAEDLTVNGTLTANYADDSVPQTAIIGLADALKSDFTTDVTTTKRLFVDEDVTMNKRLFITNDLSLGGNVFMGSATGKVTVFDLSINDDASVKGDLHVDGNLYANFADGSIPQSALEASEDSSAFTTDLSTTKRAFVDNDMTLSKRLFVANDLSMAGNLIMGGTNSKITVFDLSVNDDASVTGDLHVGGALVANFTDESIPQSAIIGGVGSNVFTEDIQAGARAFIDEDVTMKKRLFITNDLSLGGNVYIGSQIGKLSVFDLSINDDASVTGDLHVGGALVANFTDNSIPQSAIIGGVGSSVFTEDIQAGARAFIDEDVTMKKRLFIANDLSLGGNVYIGSQIGKLSVFDLSINDDASVKRNLHVDGTLTVGTYPDESIPQSAIIGGVGSNVFTEDIQAGARAFVDKDVTMKKRLFIANDLSLGGNIFLGSTNSRIDVKDISVNNDLTVAGVLTASYADETIPQSAIIGGVGSNVFTEDISANKKMNIDDTVTMNKNLIVVTDLSLGGTLNMTKGKANIYDISVNNDLTVTGNIIGNYPAETIPQSAIIGGVGSNVFTTDISANKKMNIDDTVTMNKDLVVVTDLSLGGVLNMAASQAKIYDISVNNDLTVAGNIIANYPAETIPQSAIIGGVGSNVFTIDISANKRMFIDDTVTMNKDLVIATDLSMGGTLNMAAGEANILDLNVKNNLTVDKDVTIKGLLNVQQYSNQNIINTTTTNYQLIVSEDLSLNGNLSVSNDAEVTNRLFIGPSEKTFIGVSQSSTTEMNQIGFFTNNTEHARIGSDGTVWIGSPGSAQATGTLHAGTVSGIQVDANSSTIQTANITTGNISTANITNLVVNGTMNVPDASIPASAIVGEVSTTSSGTPNFLLDVSMNKRLFVKSDLSMGGDLTVVGDASFNNTLQAQDLVVTGTTTFAAASIKAEAIDGNVGVDFTNDISMNKRLFVMSDVSMGGRLDVVGDASFNNALQAKDLIVTGTTSFPDASIPSAAIIGGGGGSADFSLDVSMNKRLFVLSDVSMGGRLDVIGDASFNGGLNVAGAIKSTGNIVANVTGNVSGTAATVTENTQGAITTLPSLTGIGTNGGSLAIGSHVEVQGNLDVNSTTTFAAGASFYNTVQIGNNSTGIKASILGTNGNIVTDGELLVTGDTKINTDKFVVTAGTGNTAIAGTLGVTGAVTFSNHATVGGALGVTGVTTLYDAATIAGTLGVTGVTTMSDNATVGGTLGVTGVTTLSDAATVGGTLGVTGVTTLSDAATVGGTLGVGGNLTVDTNKFEVVAASGNTSVGGTLSVTSDLAVNGTNFTVAGATGNTSIAGTLAVTGATTMSDNATVGGTLGVTGVTTLSDAATVGGTLGVTGVTTLSDAATVGGTLGVTGVTTLSNNASVGGTLTVTGATTLNDNVSVADTKTFTVGTGASSMGGSLTVAGTTSLNDAATIGGTLTVTGATTLNDNVSVADAKTFTVGTGASSMGGSLTVAGTTTLNDNVSVADAKTFTVGTGASSMGGSLTIEGETIINDNFFIKSDGTNKVTMTQSNGNIKNSGYLWAESQLIIGDTDKFTVLGTTGETQIGGDTKINTDKFVVTASTGNTAIAGTLNVDGNAVLKSDLSLNQQLFVGQNAVFDKDVTIEGNLNVQQYQSENIINTTTTNYQLIVSEDLSLNGRLFADYDASFGANIFVENNSILNNDVSMNSRLFVFGDVSMNNDLFVNEKSILNNDVSMNSRLFVFSDVSMNNDLFVNEKSILNNDVSMNNRLFVFGDSSFNNNVFISGGLDVSGAISMDGDVSLNNSLFTANDISVNGINIGRGAGNSNTNTVVGKDALITNSTGTKNTAFGIDSLKFNTTGISNTAGGQKSLFNNAQGSYNTAFGTEALLDTTAGYNTGIGYQALKSNTTGTNNTAIGNAAGLNSQQGTSNTFVGYGADIDTNATGTIDFSTAIGYNAKATESNQVIIGGDATNGRIFLNANDISGNVGTLDVKLINFTAESIPANAIEGSSSETTSLTGAVIMNSSLRVDGSANLQHDTTIGGRAWLQDRLYVGGRVDVVNDASFNSNVQMANINGMVSFVTTGNIEIAGAISQGTALNATEYTNYDAKIVSPAFNPDVVRSSTNGQYVAVYDDGSGNNMYMSKDYGATFTTVSLGTTGTGVTDSTYDINRRVSMDETGQYIVLVGNSNVCWSNNYGVSFSTSLSDSTLTYTCASTNGQYLAVGTNNEKLYISTDYGATLPAHAQGPVNIEGDDGSGGSGEKHNWRHVAVNSTGKYIACVTDTKIYGYADAAAAYGSSSVFTNNTTNSTLTGAEITALQTLHMTRDGNYIFTSIDGAVYRAPTGSITNGSWKNTSVQSTTGAYWNISSTTTSGMDGRFLYLVDKNNAGKVLASNDYGATIADDPQSSDATRDYQNITVTGNGAYTYANTATGLFVKEYKDGTTASIVTGEAFILSQDASFNNRIFVDHDVSFNKRLFVGENSILNGDVSMNSKMNIEGDLSMNSRLFVKKSVNSNLFMETYETYSANKQEYTVTANGSSNYVLDGYGLSSSAKPNLSLTNRQSVQFTMATTVNNSHPFKIGTSANGGEITDAQVSSTTSGSNTIITFTASTVGTYYYYCGSHTNMGGSITVSEGGITEMEVRVVSKTAQHRFYNNGSSSGYLINEGESPYLTFVPGKSYRFLQPDSTNSTHQIKFYLSPDKVDVDGNSSLYENGVTYNGTAGSAGAYTQIDVSMGTPSVLYYQCVNHGLMGNQINVLGSKSFDGDLSYNVIKLPSGTTNQRPTSIERGVVRYNTTTDQFEGYGAGNAWGSLGGVIDVDQDTYIKAETAANDDNDQLQFFTAGTQRMIIGNNGDISMNHDLKLNSDSGKITLGLDDDVIIKHDGTDGLDIDSEGALSLNSSAGAINLGDDAVTGAINIGSGASARTITVGNDASTKVDVNATAIELDAGTGGFLLNSASTSTAGIDIASAGGVRMSVADGGRLRIANADGDTRFQIEPNATAAHERVELRNTSGTATDALKLIATAGGLDLDAGTQVTIDAGSTMTLTSADALTLTDGTATFSMGGTGATSITGATTMTSTTTGTTYIGAGGGLTIDETGNSILQILARGTGNTGNQIKISNETGTSADSIVLISDAGGMDITSAKVMDITTSANDANINVLPNGTGTLTLGQDTNTKVDVNALAIELDAGATGMVLNSAGTLDIDTSGAVTIDAGTSIALTSTDALTLTDGTATLSLGGTGATSISGATTLDLDSTGALSLNSSAGIINIGDDAAAGAINIGSGASARTIRVGNDASTKVDVNALAIELDAGATGMVLNSAGTLDVDTSGAVTIDAATSIALTSTDALTLTDGTATFSMGGTGATSISGATTLDVDATGALRLNSSGGAISIGNDANTGAINIGSGASARTITVGNDASTKVDVNALAIELDAGATGMVLNSAGTIDMDATGALRINSSGGPISIGHDANTAAINIGTGAAAKDIIIGNKTGATDMTIRGGTGGILLDSTGGVTIDTTDTTNGIKVGTSTSGVPITIGHGTSEVTVADNLTVAGTASVTSDATVGGNLVVTGNMTVNGTTTTINTTNTTVSDSIMELASGTSGNPANDAGLIIERGSSDNAFIGWDETNDKFKVGTTTATGSTTGTNLTITTGTLVANLEGNVTGNVTGDLTGTVLTVAQNTITTMTGLTAVGATGVNTTFSGPIVASEGLSGTVSTATQNSINTMTGLTAVGATGVDTTFSGPIVASEGLSGTVSTATQNSITTMAGLVSVGTSGTDTEFAGRVVANDLSMGGAITLGGHIIPNSNAAYDLGSAEYKIRHLYLSNNSFWIGDKHKIDVSGGRLKFKEANLAQVPITIKAAYDGDETAAKTAAEAATSPGRNKELTAFTLNDWLLFSQASGKTINGNTGTDISIDDIFTPHGENFSVDAAGDIGFSDLSFNSTTVLDICGNINLPPSSIPSSAIIGGVGSNDFSSDVTMSNRLFVARDLSFNQRIFIGGDISMNMGSYIHQF